jgi:hypothetical protein
VKRTSINRLTIEEELAFIDHAFDAGGTTGLLLHHRRTRQEGKTPGDSDPQGTGADAPASSSTTLAELILRLEFDVGSSDIGSALSVLRVR